MPIGLRLSLCALTLFTLFGCGGGGSSTAGTTAPESPVEQAPASQQSSVAFRIETVVDGLEHPWDMAFLPDGRLLITERPGRLSLLDPTSNSRVPVTGLPELAAVGQGGLLDVALHPRFAENGWAYLSYSAAGDGGLATHVGRGRLQDGQLSGFQELFRTAPFAEGGQHFGGRLAFDRNGFLFLGLGDRGQRDRAQDLGDPNGSLLRLTDEGIAPVDNPFVGRDDAADAVYSYGHRNIQGLAVHPETGRPWLHEHGPQGGDELNLPEAGKNYGWPVITYGEEYGGGVIGPTHREGMEQPIHHWTPSIAPSGMTFYTGTAFPAWQGSLFIGALAGQHLVRLSLEGSRVVAQERLLEEREQRIRAVEQGSDGFLYLLVDAEDAPLLRLRPQE
jgi:glucose/arabinose dehydrogenase